MVRQPLPVALFLAPLLGMPLSGCRAPAPRIEEERLARAERVIKHWRKIALDNRFVGFVKTEEATLDGHVYLIHWVYDRDVRNRGFYTPGGETFAFVHRLGKRTMVPLGRQDEERAVRRLLNLPPKRGVLRFLPFQTREYLEEYPIEQPGALRKEEVTVTGEEGE